MVIWNPSDGIAISSTSLAFHRIVDDVLLDDDEITGGILLHNACFPERVHEFAGGTITHRRLDAVDVDIDIVDFQTGKSGKHMFDRIGPCYR